MAEDMIEKKLDQMIERCDQMARDVVAMRNAAKRTSVEAQSTTMMVGVVIILAIAVAVWWTAQ